MNRIKYLAIALLASRQGDIAWQQYSRLTSEVGELEKFLEGLARAPGLNSLWQRVADAGQIRRAEDEVMGFHERGIELIALGESCYPALLAAMYDPPRLLFVARHAEGCADFFPWQKPCVGVVGSRTSDERGCLFAEEVGEALVARGVCVVSGLAYGVDAASHRGALRASRCGATVAVLGHGLDHLYPASHRELALRIKQSGGVLLSHFEPRVRPYPSHFLARNRVLAGLCKAVLVVQAHAKSGSLVTARFALEEGRDVLVVPGDIADRRYVGSNRLIQKGAYLVTSVEDVMQLIDGLEPPIAASDSRTRDHSSALSEPARAILDHLLESGPLHSDKIFATFSARYGSALSEAILGLELERRIVRLAGNYFAACGQDE